jgi:two-component system, sensor histidine kinase YesM
LEDKKMELTKYKWVSLQRKILFIYIILLLVPFSLAFIAFSYKTAERNKRENTNYMMQLTKQISSNISIIISDVEKMSYLHIVDADLQTVIKKDYQQDPVEYLKDARYMMNVIAHSKSLNPFIIGVTYIGKNGNIYSNTDTSAAYISEIGQWIKIIKESGTDKYISPVYEGIINQCSREMITLTRQLYNSETMDPVGSVSINVDFDRIKTMFNRSSSSEMISDYIILCDDKIIFNSSSKQREKEFNDSEDLVSKINKAWQDGDSKVFSLNFNRKRYLFVGESNSQVNWKIIQYISYDSIYSGSKENIKFYLAFLFILLSVAVVVSYLFSIEISKPITKLHVAMQGVHRGDFRLVEGENKRKDELGFLVKSYNEMCTRLQESIKKQYVAQMNKKQIELKMLQAQINPHFLYNTLNLISSIAEFENIEEISTISNCLSDLFRYNIKGREIVKLKEELEQVENYIYIQKMRFPNKFEIKYDIEPDLYEVSILKFLIQPIVENAIYHGLERKRNQGLLEITIKRADNNLKINIRDNGGGMTEEKMNSLNNKLRNSSNYFILGDKKESIGLQNVHYRIQDYYGEEYGIEVVSEVNYGTDVKISIPLIYEFD